MDRDDIPMDTTPSTTPASTHSPPSTRSPSSAPPTPPPPPPLPLLPPIPCQPESAARPLPSFVGPLDSATRSALRQNKWPLILLLPRQNPVSAPTSPTRPRPAWGPDAYHAPKKLHAPPDLVDNVLLWRRTASSSHAERYTAFFPTDGLPHLALLDPRSGERLAVWGNVDGQGMDSDGIADSLWEQVQNDMQEFLKSHSLEDGALGPAHHQEKPWAVRTRRVTEKKSMQNALPPTSVMDDEEAAIAAAIAASLAEAQEDSYFGSGSEDEHEHEDDDSDDMFSGDTSQEENDDGGDSNALSDDFVQNQSTDGDEQNESEASSPQPVAVRMSSSLGNIPPPSQRPILIPSRGEPLPSSVESLSSSYLERMESCFRSSTNSALMETRRLRQEQDAELAASLQEDRQREEQERAEAECKAAKKQAMLDAVARLPDEPAENAEAFTIAIRLPAGKRIMRRFNSFDPLQSIADFAIAEYGCVSLINRTPETGLRIAGIKLAGHSWNTALRELGLSSRTMIILSE